MSIQAVGWVLDHSEARGITRLVLISIANHANADAECWPSQRTLAREAGIGKGTVPEAIKRLVDIGELIVVDAGDTRRSARYRMVMEGARLPTSGAQEPGAAPGPGVGAAPGSGPGRTIKNRQEPSASRSLQAQRFPGELDIVTRCPECHWLTRDCTCEAQPSPPPTSLSASELAKLARDNPERITTP